MHEELEAAARNRDVLAYTTPLHFDGPQHAPVTARATSSTVICEADDVGGGAAFEPPAGRCFDMVK